jgi:hypothetical protein
VHPVRRFASQSRLQRTGRQLHQAGRIEAQFVHKAAAPVAGYGYHFERRKAEQQGTENFAIFGLEHLRNHGVGARRANVGGNIAGLARRAGYDDIGRVSERSGHDVGKHIGHSGEEDAHWVRCSLYAHKVATKTLAKMSHWVYVMVWEMIRIRWAFRLIEWLCRPSRESEKRLGHWAVWSQIRSGPEIRIDRSCEQHILRAMAVRR